MNLLHPDVVERIALRRIEEGIAAFESVEELYRQEQDYARIAAERLAAGEYFPGFFVFLARKTA